MKRLLLSAAAVAVIAVPGLSLADPNHDQRDEHHPAAAQEHQARPNAPQGGMNQRYAPQQLQQHGNFAAPTRNYPQQNFQRQPQYGVQRSAPTEGQWTRNHGGSNFVQPGQTTGQNTWRGDSRRGQYNGFRNGGVQGQYNGYRNGGVQGQYTGNRTGDWRGQHNGDRNGGWQGQNNGRGQYTRDRNGRWQGQNDWRGHDHDRGEGWWRGQRGFERYEGRRDGYWFAPGWGYYQPDSRWYGYNWEVGGIVPYELRGYYVSDPYAYDLPPAPYGCEWIYLGDQLVLIDLASGQIVDMGDSY